ncbi:MAG: AAA-like domain-containing protein, partial [Cyanobacteria bacterium J06600_6]
MTDLDIGKALKVVAQILEPEKLNAVQEVVLRECWLGKTYQEIAAGSGYDADYIRVVGSRLWQNLSLAAEEKVSKNNFKSVLEDKASKGKFSLVINEFPDGQVPPNSSFYIERPPYETKIYDEISNPGGFVVIKSPLNMGKTSLMSRTLSRVKQQNYHTVTLNLQLAEASVLSDLEKFLRWLMANVTLQLSIGSQIDKYWDRDLGAKVSCTNYLQTHILNQLNEPLVMAFDEANHLFEYPDIAREFLPLLRFWHEEANNSATWQRLRMIVVHSTDMYIPLEINQSPFNLGLPIILPEFSSEQVQELASRHQFQLEIADLDRSIEAIMIMVGGFPYLIRKAFYVLATQPVSVEDLLAAAPTLSGIYRTHLQSYFTILRQHPDLI